MEQLKNITGFNYYTIIALADIVLVVLFFVSVVFFHYPLHEGRLQNVSLHLSLLSPLSESLFMMQGNGFS